MSRRVKRPLAKSKGPTQRSGRKAGAAPGPASGAAGRRRGFPASAPRGAARPAPFCRASPPRAVVEPPPLPTKVQTVVGHARTRTTCGVDRFLGSEVSRPVVFPHPAHRPAKAELAGQRQSAPTARTGWRRGRTSAFRRLETGRAEARRQPCRRLRPKRSGVLKDMILFEDADVMVLNKAGRFWRLQGGSGHHPQCRRHAGSDGATPRARSRAWCIGSTRRRRAVC